MLGSQRITPVTAPAPSNVTRVTLLSRVRDPSDAAAWSEFEARYRPLLVRFCRRQGLQQADAEDVTQIILTNLVRALPKFVYDSGRGRFRDYLFRCARNAITNWAARPTGRDVALDTSIEAATAPDGAAADPESARAWEAEWIAHHYRLAMRTIRETFEARSVEVFDRSVAGETVAALSAAFGMSEQAVHKVRQRIKGRMEELIARQIAEEDDTSAAG